MENDNRDRREWITQSMDTLAPPTGWVPDVAGARSQLSARLHSGASSRRYLIPAAVAAAACIVLLVNPGTRVRAQQLWKWLTVGSVEVVRVDFANLPEQARSLHPTLLQQPSAPQAAADADEAARMAGFAARLPTMGVLPGVPRLSVIAPMSFGVTVKTVDLEMALRAAGVTDQPVPRAWDGAKLVMQFGHTIVAEWTDISLMQTQPPSLSAPESFDLGEFTVALLRAAGMPRESAQRFGRRMNTAPVLLCGISEDEHVAISDVRLRNGNGTLIENYGDTGTIERVELLWSSGDRVFVFSGATTIELAKAVANQTE